MYPTTAVVRTKDYFLQQLALMFKNAREGVVLKELTSTYKQGESNHWAKVRKVTFKECLITKKDALGNNLFVYVITDEDNTEFVTQPTGLKFEVGDKVSASFPTSGAPRLLEKGIANE